jgi:hypothetical protein
MSKTKKPAARSRKRPVHPDLLATAVAPDGAVDPTLLTSKVKIGGREITMCWDLGSLARAEHELRSSGHDVNLLKALPALTLENTMVLFAASVRRFHPEITFEKAMKMLTLANVYTVGVAIADAWARSLADPGKDAEENPTQPGK